MPRPADADPAPFADLVFSEIHRWHPFQVVAPEFALVVAPGPGPYPHGHSSQANVGPVAPFAGVEVDLRRVRGTLRAGLQGRREGRSVGVWAAYDAVAGRVRIEAYVDDQERVLRSRRIRLPDGGALGFALCEQQVTVLARDDDGWRPLLTERDRVAVVADLRDPAVLAAYHWAWGHDGNSEIGEVRFGPFGMTGLRDPHLVQHADGTPYARDGRMFLTWTCAGLGGFRQAHWGVFSFDPEHPGTLTQTGQLYSRRDGLLLGDHAGQLVRDGDRWLAMTSSWGDFTPGRGVHVRHCATDADLLTGVHVLETEPTPMPTALDTWDPGFTRVGDRWLTGYVESASQRPFRFHPALAESYDAEPWSGLRRIGGADELRRCEGPVLVQRDGRSWLLASDGAARRYPVFDHEMNPAGAISAPYPTNIPHPQLVPRPDGSWLLVTFDGTTTDKRNLMGYGGHGDVVVMNTPPGHSLRSRSGGDPESTPHSARTCTAENRRRRDVSAPTPDGEDLSESGEAAALRGQSRLPRPPVPGKISGLPRNRS